MCPVLELVFIYPAIGHPIGHSDAIATAAFRTQTIEKGKIGIKSIVMNSNADRWATEAGNI